MHIKILLVLVSNVQFCIMTPQQLMPSFEGVRGVWNYFHLTYARFCILIKCVVSLFVSVTVIFSLHISLQTNRFTFDRASIAVKETAPSLPRLVRQT